MAQKSFDLTGQWNFGEYPISARRMRDLDSLDWLPTDVPCSIFSSLITADKIQLSKIEANPENFSWVSEKPWVYKKTFDISAELLECNRVDLVFEGLDTIASIWLNDKLVAKTNNMFIPFRFDVTEFLNLKNNVLMIKFDPAVQYAKKMMDRYTKFSESDFKNPYRVYIRKAQYQFGWDFCPSLPGCGIFRPVRLEGIQKAHFDDLSIRTIDCNDSYADIKVTAKLDAIVKEQFVCKLTLSFDNQTATHEHKIIFQPGEGSHSTVIRIDNPQLWWPAGYGRQNLYILDAQLISGNEIIDQLQKNIGIRNIKLNRSLNKYGEKFQFEVNGQPIFIRGANWVPASIFAGSTTDDDYESLLQSAKEANINMLRVWAGGYYESEKFYDICDRLGIMVWQDFMFARAYYPNQQWFLDEIKTEASAVIKQLRSHTSLSLWCGNSEIDWMHSVGKLGKSKKFYGEPIYRKLLAELVTELAPDVTYIPTTPLSEKAKFQNDKLLTSHQWNVWSSYDSVDKYLCSSSQIPKFVTEFGLQSLPDFETVKSFCLDKYPRITSACIEKHNYQLDGNSRLYRYMADLFGTTSNIENFIYLSQLTQARAVKKNVEHLRAHNQSNNGLLFWQFNDCCPAISFSAIDYMKKPKALYYYAKRFFSALIIAVVPWQTKPLHPDNIVIVNDNSQPVTATLNCNLIDLFGNILDKISLPVAVAPFSTSTPLKLPKAMTHPDEPQKCVLHVTLDGESKKIAENLFFYLPDKHIDWPNTEITHSIIEISENKYKLTLKSNGLAKDVHISAGPSVQMSENFMDLIPTQKSEIILKCRTDIPTSSLKFQSVKSVL